MRRRHPIIVPAVAACLALTGSLPPAYAGGLIPTERLVAPAPATAPAAEATAEMRAGLHAALVAAGVDGAFAQQRLDVLSDAEIARLVHDIDTAPAGGAWFVPFLVVAAVIGVLIGSRDAGPTRSLPATDLFGRPRNIASTP